MRHCIGLAAQVDQGSCNPALGIEKGQVFDLASGMEQALGQLGADRGHDLESMILELVLQCLAQARVGNLGQFTLAARAHQYLALGRAHEQTHLTDEIAGVEIAEDQFTAVVAFSGHSD